VQIPDRDQYAVFTLDLEQLEPGDVIITARRRIDPGGVFIRMGNFFKRGFADGKSRDGSPPTV